MSAVMSSLAALMSSLAAMTCVPPTLNISTITYLYIAPCQGNAYQYKEAVKRLQLSLVNRGGVPGSVTPALFRQGLAHLVGSTLVDRLGSTLADKHGSTLVDLLVSTLAVIHGSTLAYLPGISLADPPGFTLVDVAVSI